jgi:hypothetical protein
MADAEQKAEQKPDKPPLWIGLLCTGIGLYFMLVGLGLLPVPGGPRNMHAPLWVGFAAGLVFFLGGLALLVQVLGRANAQGELPKDAPAWMKAAQHVFAILIFAAFASIGTWIAFGPGDRQFGGNVPLTGRASEIAGRAAFGLGAVICWLGTLAMFNRARKQRFGAGKG